MFVHFFLGSFLMFMHFFLGSFSMFMHFFLGSFSQYKQKTTLRKLGTWNSHNIRNKTKRSIDSRNNYFVLDIDKSLKESKNISKV